MCIAEPDVTRLSSGERKCLQNCVNRWFDTHDIVVEKLYPSAGSMELEKSEIGGDLMANEKDDE